MYTTCTLVCVCVYVCVCVCVCIYVCLCFVKMAFSELQLVYCSGQRCGQEGWRAAVVPPAAATVQAEPADVEAKRREGRDESSARPSFSYYLPSKLRVVCYNIGRILPVYSH